MLGRDQASAKAARALIEQLVAQIGAAHADYKETYGSIGAIVVLMMWFWISAFMIVLGGALNAELEHQTTRDSTAGPDRPMGRREATKADRLGSPLGP